MTGRRHRGGGLFGWPDWGRRTPTDPAAPLFELVPRKAPPPGLLFRIEAEIDVLERTAAAARLTRGQLVAAAIGGAVATASVVALLLGVPQRPGAPLVLADAAGTPVLKVERGSGSLRLGPPISRPDGALELWLIRGGEGAPISLGLVAPKGDVTLLPLAVPPRPGDVLALSIEPQGGSPAPGPTGPVIASVTVPRG